MTAEEYVKNYTRRCSNETTLRGSYDHTYEPWLPIDEVLEAIRLAREDVKKELLNNSVNE